MKFEILESLGGPWPPTAPPHYVVPPMNIQEPTNKSHHHLDSHVKEVFESKHTTRNRVVQLQKNYLYLK